MEISTSVVYNTDSSQVTVSVDTTCIDDSDKSRHIEEIAKIVGLLPSGSRIMVVKEEDSFEED